jgi:uncharacterized protein YeaO (DUF488 family)
MITIKRAYEAPSPADGTRILVDRLWPRGLTKSKARVDEWRKDLAPSEELRKWYAHDPLRFERFRCRYRAELLRRPEAWTDLVRLAGEGTVTLLFAARSPDQNNAAVLRELIAGSFP